MSINTIFTCDHCGKVVTKEDSGLFELKVTVRMVYPSVITTNTDCMPMQHWCRDCLNGSAILGITDKMLEDRRLRELSVPVPATLESIIREIAYEAAVEGTVETLNKH